MAKFELLEPGNEDGYITDAKYIKGAYFVIEKYDDLANLTVVDDEYPTVGTIVKGSMCYCQGDGLTYWYNGTSWEVANINVGVDTSDDTEDEKPTADLHYTHITLTDSYMVSGFKDDTDPTGCRSQNIYENVVIPSTYTGDDNVVRKVTQIASHAFDGCDKLETVVIPDSITFIDEKAFHNCTSLKFVEIPPSVTNLGVTVGAKYPGGEVFKGCSSLKWVSIPLSVKTIGFHTFLGCTRAKLHCEAPSKPEGWYLDDYGISWNPENCEVKWGVYLETAKISSPPIISNGKEYKPSKGLLFELNIDGTCEVTGIGACTDKELVIPSTYDGRPVTRIGEDAFKDNTTITNVVIGENVKFIGDYAFCGCPYLKRITLPSTLKTIGEKAFFNCTKLSYVVIPKSVYSIGHWAFSNCINCNTIFIEHESLEASQLGTDWFPSTKAITPNTSATIDSLIWWLTTLQAEVNNLKLKI